MVHVIFHIRLPTEVYFTSNKGSAQKQSSKQYKTADMSMSAAPVQSAWLVTVQFIMLWASNFAELS